MTGSGYDFPCAHCWHREHGRLTSARRPTPSEQPTLAEMDPPERKRNLSTQPIVHKEIEAMQVAAIKALVEKRADIFPLFEPLRQACGDAICGPAMAVFHFGAVKDGFLVEAAFPVSRPVETEQVYTRTLEDARAWTQIHRGSHEEIRGTATELVEHARTHAGTIGWQREVYLVLDLDDPEQNLTEVQFIKHEWDRLLAEGLERNLGGEARQLVMDGIEQIAPESSLEEYTEWIRGAMDALDSLTGDPEKKYQVLSCCAHVFPDERIAHLRSIYERRRDIDDVLQEMYQDPAWYEDPVRKGNVLHMRKVPYRPGRVRAGGYAGRAAESLLPLCVRAALSRPSAVQDVAHLLLVWFGLVPAPVGGDSRSAGQDRARRDATQRA